jgi:Raf kinase inhibitor-like YbhB/YbcL family protein
MLEKLPSTLGRAAQGVRAGADDLAIADTELTGVNASIEVSSQAFGYNEPIPAQYTADGEGLSPPLEWRCVPMNAEAVVVLVEDADSPTPRPLVHAIVWDLPGSDASLPEGALPSTRDSADPVSEHLGRNSALSATWLPPDPPPGHGAHRYVFQVFALDIVPRFESRPGRPELLDKIRGHVIAKGLLIGTYERK